MLIPLSTLIVVTKQYLRSRFPYKLYMPAYETCKYYLITQTKIKSYFQPLAFNIILFEPNLNFDNLFKSVFVLGIRFSVT